MTAGETDLQNRDSPYIEALLIWALMVHPAYDTLKKNNDIAVARVSIRNFFPKFHYTVHENVYLCIINS